MLFKFILIGNTGTGKSCILHRFTERKCATPCTTAAVQSLRRCSLCFLAVAVKPSSAHTIGVEFGTKLINIAGKNIRLQIWDTAGQERYRRVAHRNPPRFHTHGTAEPTPGCDTNAREPSQSPATPIARQQACMGATCELWPVPCFPFMFYYPSCCQGCDEKLLPRSSGRFVSVRHHES